MRRLTIAVVLGALLTASASISGFAQEPEPTPTVTETPVAEATTPTPAATPTVPATVAPAAATISGRLVEDLNDNGAFDAEDGPPSQQTLVQLLPWATPDRFVRVLTADDGSFSFVNVPTGDYTLSVWWMSGFVDATSDRLPHALRIVLRVASDGSIAAPSPLPAMWPELPAEEFNPERDGTIIGPVPDIILLKLKPPGLFPYPVEVADTAAGPLPVGVVDVGQVLKERPTALPRTGDGSADDVSGLLRWLGAGLLALAVLSGVILARSKIRA